MIAKSLLLALVAGALAVAAAGCGGDDGGGGDRLSKPEFIAKADAICKEFAAKGEAIKEPSFDPTAANTTDEQLDEFGDYLDQVKGVFDDEVEELGDVNAPEDLEADYKRAVATLEETSREIGEAAEAAHDADRDKLKEKLEEVGRHSDEADELAKKLGLTVCGSA